MWEWILQNIGTILICIALCAVLAGVIVSLVRNKKRGKCACGGSCGHCPMSGTCHAEKTPKDANAVSSSARPHDASTVGKEN